MGELQKSLKASSSLLSVSVSLLLLLLCLSMTATTSMAATRIAVGVILDLDSTLGKMVNHSLALALEDYYLIHSHSNYKINLQVRSVPENDVVAAAETAFDLIKNRSVRAILGPQNSEQARLIVELGEKFRVPVIWFPLTGPSLLPPASPSSDQGLHCFQFRAIADIIKSLGWQSIVPIYEETEYGSHLISCLPNVLKDAGIRMANVTAIDSSNLTDHEELIKKALDKLKGMQTHEFLVHMSMDFGARFMNSAQQRDMMDEGYAWILTQGLSSLTSPTLPIRRKLYHPNGKTSKVNDNVRLTRYMQGALGVRPMDSSNKTKERQEIEKKFSDLYKRTLSMYGWWAYHTLEALAMAVEKVGKELNNGIKLQDGILATNFKGDSGLHFDLRTGELNQPVLEVYNVIGDRERIIGYWSPESGLAQNYNKSGKTSGKYQLKDPQLWPGDTFDKPPKMRIGVLPATNSFPEIFNVDNYSATPLMVGGFVYNVFLKALEALPFPFNNYEFVPMPNNSRNGTTVTYDDFLCNQTKVQDLDAVIGDITIVANRTECVDFTLPYLYSSVAMVVRVNDDSKSNWILLKPFRWSLWLILGVIFVVATFVINLLRRKGRKTDPGSETNEEASKTNRYFNETVLVYKMDVMKINSGSKAAAWMVILTSFLFVLVLQVYTANLTSILTQGKTKEPSFEDEKEIKSRNLCVGYRNGSWVKGLLTQQIGFKEDHLKAYTSREEYNEALSKGTKKGGVDAIFDETPYLNLFLSRFKSPFMMTGPIYKTGGFAFAFPKKSGLVLHFSKAILNVTQDVEAYRALMTKSSLPTTIEDLAFEDPNDDKEASSLSIDDFKGLYPVLASVVLIFLFTIFLR